MVGCVGVWPILMDTGEGDDAGSAEESDDIDA
jgi:hypothetical protein